MNKEIATKKFPSSLEESKELSNKSNNIKKNRKAKAVALLSGGLDSQIAIHMMKEQDIEVEAVAIKTPFCDFDCGKGCGHRVLEVATDLDIKLKTIYLGKEYLSMIKNPKYGYGSGMNPCIDCRMMMYNEAKKHMEKIGADFLITGEVLQQRPMSQNNKALKIIEQETELEGRVLRPLSARLLPPTEPEKNGQVNVSKLGSIRGRSRKDQLSLANKYEIINPPNSAGGCLLTDPQFAIRIRDLYKHSLSEPTINDVEFLKIGRHFRLDQSTKLIVGRNHDENEKIITLWQKNDYLIQPKIIPGPISILRVSKKPNFRRDKKVLSLAMSIALRYSDTEPSKTYEIIIKCKDNNIIKSTLSYPCESTLSDNYRI